MTILTGARAAGDRGDPKQEGSRGTRQPDDGRLSSYDPKDRLGPALSGSGDEQKGKIDLEEVPFLYGCSLRQLRSVAKIARVLDAAAGTVLTHRGESGDELFLILDGTANVHLSDEKSVSLGPGAIFGEMSLLDGGTLGHDRFGDTDPPSCGQPRELLALLQGSTRLHPNVVGHLSLRVRQAEW